MKVWLYFLVDKVKYGGFATYTAQLALALRDQGHQVQICRITKRTETKIRPFAEGQGYQNVCLEDALFMTAAGTPHIVCTNWKQYAEQIKALIGAGAGITMHDPTEFSDDLFGVLREAGRQVVVIRKANQGNLEAEGLSAFWIRHPYMRAPSAEVSDRELACSLSRVDWDKYTHVIAEANEILDGAGHVDIYGQENRIYTYHKVDKERPGWRKHYKGTFPIARHASVDLARRYRFVVDMSAISKDGGGTQYTFLEAIDAGCTLVLNSKWRREDDRTMDTRAAFVDDAAGLAAALMQADAEHESTRAEGRKLLRQHTPRKIVTKYEAYWKDIA